MINTNNISEFHVSAECYETNPCSHECWFFFADGNDPITVDVYKEDIKNYLSKIDENKIHNPCGDEHFTQSTSLYPDINNPIDYTPSNFFSMPYVNRQTPTNNNPLNTEIDVNQVSSFQISNDCMEIFPCKHKCTILSGDTIVVKTLNQPEIKWCIDKIPSDKIKFEGFSLSHFVNN